MELRKFAACTVCLMTVLAAAGCADGTGQALTPTLPTVESNTTNADGTRLKASAPQPRSPISAARVTSLTPTLRLANGAGQFDPNVQLSYVFEIFDGTDQNLTNRIRSPRESPETVLVVPENLLKMNKTYAWRASARFGGVSGSLSDVVSFQSPLPPRPADAIGLGRFLAPATPAATSSPVWPTRIPERLVKTTPATSATSAAPPTWSSCATSSLQPASAKASSRTEQQARRAGHQQGLHRAGAATPGRTDAIAASISPAAMTTRRPRSSSPGRFRRRTRTGVTRSITTTAQWTARA